MSHKLLRLGLAISGLILVSTLSSWQCAISQQEDVEERQAVAITQRFLSIVEKNPQRGTAFEKVFTHHLQRGTLDSFVSDLEKRTKENTADSVAWMLLGLIESQRRMDTQAILAFAEAERLRPNDAFPAYYRGQCLLRTGEPTHAIEAFEKAIERKPARVVLLELFELVGRTHQRQNRNDLAIEVWKRLEGMFPDDVRVLEQIASVQKQEGAFRESLPRYERLIMLTKDAYQRTQFRIEVAQLRLKLGSKEQGLADLESILSELKPDGWLYRDVQRKIEEVFLASSDQVGLIKYYENRLTKFPDDLESVMRLSKFLASSDRMAEANNSMSLAIERAPSRIDLRSLLIGQLLADGQIALAVEQYSHLSQLDPKNTDILRDWGKLVLRDPSRSIEAGKNEAGKIWRRILEFRSEDALAHVQVAELFLSAKMPEEARKLFERAIGLRPEEVQYHEYYGEFLFQQNLLDQAFAAWDAIAEGPRRNAESVMRLAEIYHHAQQRDQAANLAAEACRLEPSDPIVFMRAARLQSKADRIDEALESLAVAERLADSDDQRETIIQERMGALEKSNRLNSEADTLQKHLRQEKNPTVAQSQLLARYLVRLRRWKEADMAVNEALRLEASNLTMLRASSEVAQGLGNVEQSILSLRKLADFDRRKRQEYLQQIARLQIRQKKWAAAIETANEAVQAVPSKIESYEFMAQICFQAKKPELGIETLRKALRIDPNSSHLTIALGSALSERKNYNEAIELYWQSFAKSNTLDDKVDLTLKLVKLYQKQNSLPQLIDRLETGRKDAAQRRDLTICIAHVHQSVTDFANARRVLEELLTDRTHDAAVLEQLAKLSLSANDIELAIDYQRQLVAVVPSQENESYLATLLQQHGNWNEAYAIVVRLLQSDRDTVAVVKNIDELLQQGEFDLVLETLEPILRKESDNWELLYRLGRAHAGIDQWEKARAAFERVLMLDVGHDELGVRRTNPSKSRRSETTSASANIVTPLETLFSDAERLKAIERAELIDIALGRPTPSTGIATSNLKAKWSPRDFGEVRLASIAWLVCGDSKELDSKSSWIANARERAEASLTRSNLIDAMAIAKFQQNTESQLPIATGLAANGERDLQNYYLETIWRRHVSGFANENKNQKPLSETQLELALEAFESATVEPRAIPGISTNINPGINSGINSALATIAAMQSYSGRLQQGGTIFMSINGQTVTITNGQTTISSLNGSFVASNFLPILGLGVPINNLSMQRSEGFVRTIVNELRFAGQSDRAESFLTRQCESANTEFHLASLCEYLLRMKRFNEIEPPLLRWFELHRRQIGENNALPLVAAGTAPSSSAIKTPTEFASRLLEAMGERATLEIAVRFLNAAADTSNQQYRKREFATLNASSLAGNQAFNQVFHGPAGGYPSPAFQGQIGGYSGGFPGQMPVYSGQWPVYSSQITPSPLQVRYSMNPTSGYTIGSTGKPSPVQDWCKNFVSEDLQKLLIAAKELFKQSNRSNDWLEYFRDRVTQADLLVRPLERLRLGLYVDEGTLPEKNNAILIEAMEEIGRQPDCALQAAAALLRRKNFRESRKLAETVIASDPQDSLLRELVNLHASAGLSDRSRLQDSVKALANQSIDAATLGSIYGSLQSANAMNLASIISSTTNRVATSGSSSSTSTTRNTTIPAMQSRSAMLSKPSKTVSSSLIKELKESVRTLRPAEANKIARQIVSKPRVLLTSPATARLNQTFTMNSRPYPGSAFGASNVNQNAITNADANRTLAFQVLKENGELKKLIEEMETARSTSPNSFVLLELLAEYYEQEGDSERANATLKEALRLRPSASALRVHLAMRFTMRLGKGEKEKEACDQYVELIRRDANVGLATVNQIRDLFKSCGRTAELLQAIRKVNFHSLSNRDEILLEARQLLNSPESFELGAQILETLADLDSPTRQQALMVAYSTNNVYPRLMRFTLEGIIPNEHELADDPWFGLINSSIGQDSDFVFFDRVLSSHRKEDIAELFEPAIQAAVERIPNWFAGKFLLAIIADRPERSEESSKRFDELASNKQLIASCPESIMWRMAKLFAKRPETRPIAMRLMEPLIGNNRFAYLSLENRPATILARLWIEAGDRAKAIEMLTREYESGSGAAILQTQSQFRTQSQLAGTNSKPAPTLAEHILALGLPVEAYCLFDLAKTTEQRNVPSPPTVAKGMTPEAGKRVAIIRLEQLPTDQAVFELLQDRSNETRKLPALELMFHVPLVRDTDDQWIESELQKKLIQHAKNGKLTDIEESLQKLAVLHPFDITIPATQARLRLATGVGDSQLPLREMERILLQHEPKNTGASPQDSFISAQPFDFAKPVVSLWLVARECYLAGQHLEVADRLADRAFQVAKIVDAGTYLGPRVGINNPIKENVPEAQLANIILFEWGRVQIQTGRGAQGTLRWTELIRSIDSLNPIQPAVTQSAPTYTGKSWTKSQFDWLMQVANIAVDLGQVDVSKQIARRLATKQMPIDAPYVIGSRRATESESKLAVQSILRLTKKWGEDANIAAERYELLLSLLVSQEGEVFIFADQARLLDEQPNNMSAKLVEYASNSNRLRELKEFLDMRNTSAELLNWRILRTQIAIAEKEFETAKILLNRLFEQSRNNKTLTLACHVAIPAFRMEELRESALPILKEYLTREKESGIYPASDFDMFPLVREVNEYLRSSRDKSDRDKD